MDIQTGAAASERALTLEQQAFAYHVAQEIAQLMAPMLVDAFFAIYLIGVLSGALVLGVVILARRIWKEGGNVV